MVTAMARRWSWVQILNQDDSFPNGEPFYPTNPQGAFRYDSVQHALRRDWTLPSCISSMIMLRAAEVGLTRPLHCRQHSASDKKRSEARRGCAFEPLLHCLLLSLRSSNIQLQRSPLTLPDCCWVLWTKNHPTLDDILFHDGLGPWTTTVPENQWVH